MDVTQEPKYMIVDENGVELPNAQLANRATGKPIPKDEPVMIWRAQDLNTGQPIFLYQEICKNPGHQRVVQGRFEQFRQFQTDHPERCKEPD